MLDTFVECKVDSFWYSAQGKGRYPLYPSKIMPYRDDPNAENLPWLIEQAHERGITVMAWDYLTTAPLLAEEHPDWRVEFLGEESTYYERNGHFVCLASPYGDLLVDYCVEQIRDIGFDGIWFDGCYQRSDADFRWASRSAHMRKAFREATGEDIPETLDFANPVFRRWVRWRGEWWSAYFQSLSERVLAQQPQAVLCFNHFTRLTTGTEVGCALLRTPMQSMMVGEDELRRQQICLQARLLRAMNPSVCPEIWTRFEDTAHVPGPGRSEPDTDALTHFAAACFTAGAHPSFGLAKHPSTSPRALKVIADMAIERARWIQGKPVIAARLLISQASLDFEYPYDKLPRWQACFGYAYLLEDLHCLYGALLEDELEDIASESPIGPPVIIPASPYLPGRVLDNLERFMERGGVVIAFGDSAQFDEFGNTTGESLLSRFIRPTETHQSYPHCMVESSGLQERPDGEEFLVSGQGFTFEAKDVKCLLKGRTQGMLTKKERMKRASKDIANIDQEGAIGMFAVEKSIGEGRLVFISFQPGAAYAKQPHRSTAALIEQLLRPYLKQPLTVEGPLQVIFSAFEMKDGSSAIHLFNRNPRMRTINGLDFCNAGAPAPTGPLIIRTNKPFMEAKVVAGADQLVLGLVEPGEGRIEITSIKEHAVINIHY